MPKSRRHLVNSADIVIITRSHSRELSNDEFRALTAQLFSQVQQEINSITIEGTNQS
jgi:RNase P protein component